MPDMNDEKGTSIVLINSKKGKELFKKIKEKCIVRSIDLDAIIKYNTSLIKSSNEHKNRKNFLDIVTSNNFDVVVNKYIPKQRNSILKRIIRKIKNKR